jgi:hypothetical protein
MIRIVLSITSGSRLCMISSHKPTVEKSSSGYRNDVRDHEEALRTSRLHLYVYECLRVITNGHRPNPCVMKIVASARERERNVSDTSSDSATWLRLGSRVQPHVNMWQANTIDKPIQMERISSKHTPVSNCAKLPIFLDSTFSSSVGSETTSVHTNTVVPGWGAHKVMRRT